MPRAVLIAVASYLLYLHLCDSLSDAVIALKDLRRKLVQDNEEYLDKTEESLSKLAARRNNDNYAYRRTYNQESQQRSKYLLDTGLDQKPWFGKPNNSKGLSEFTSGSYKSRRGESFSKKTNKSTETKIYSEENSNYETKLNNFGNKRFRVVEMGGSGSGRRSMPRRVIVEEGPEAVAVFRLDDGPFPQLKLSHSRRQYMQHG